MRRSSVRSDRQIDNPGEVEGKATVVAGHDNVAYSNASVNGGVNERESEHARHDSPDSRWASL
jgi:hypothetical protein